MPNGVQSNVARSVMTMRAKIERDYATGTDPYNNKVSPTWEVAHEFLPCYLYTGRAREVIDGQKTVLIAEHKMLVPLDTDITEADRVVSIKNRATTELLGQTMGITAIIRRNGHLEVVLEAVS